MKLTRTFSLYRSKITRAAVHMILWILVYAFLLVICMEVFNIDDIFAPPILIYSAVITFLIIINHYFISYFTLPRLKNKSQSLVILLCLLLVYIYSSIISLYALTLIAKSFTNHPMLNLLSAKYSLHQVGDLFSYKTFSWFLSYILFFNIFSFLLKFSKKYYEANNDKISLIEERNLMELNFLRTQIQPHFLFNTLNNIYGLVIEDHRASQAILKLSDLLRFSLYESSLGSITLQREISFLSDYIMLEKMRHKDDKVGISFKYDDIENPSLKIQPLLLVNFIENAFKHGVNASINYSWINIILTSSKNVVTFKIENNKSQHISRNLNEKGVGLNNVRRRLELEYPERYDLSIKETEEIYAVKLTLKIDE